MSISDRILRIQYVRSAFENRSDLNMLKGKPNARTWTGLGIMLLSYIIGWPAVFVLGYFSVRLNNPLLVGVGGPAVYGLSHLVFTLGMLLAGAEYAGIFFRWATRVAVEKWMGEKIRELMPDLLYQDPLYQDPPLSDGNVGDAGDGGEPD
ncbi:MAG: hypothetical protein CSB33_01385 [Desulfobacterales bacterium]|nr:MAG: hypothetical protein CSB33_01385 [Desulfobacterales bacterium]